MKKHDIAHFSGRTDKACNAISLQPLYLLVQGQGQALDPQWDNEQMDH